MAQAHPVFTEQQMEEMAAGMEELEEKGILADIEIQNMHERTRKTVEKYGLVFCDWKEHSYPGKVVVCVVNISDSKAFSVELLETYVRDVLMPQYSPSSCFTIVSLLKTYIR